MHMIDRTDHLHAPSRGALLRRSEHCMKLTAQLLMRLGGVLLLLWSALVTVLFVGLSVAWMISPDMPLRRVGGWLGAGWFLVILGTVCAVLGVMLDQMADPTGSSTDDDEAIPRAHATNAK